jgi:NitT/TauT family transport system permease protein
MSPRRQTQLIKWSARLTLVIGLAITVYFWQNVNINTTSLISRPSDVVRAFGDWFGQSNFRSNIWPTLEEAGVGYLACVAVALVLAVALSLSKTLLRVLSPYISAFNAVPKIALAPLFILIFGTGLHGKVYFIAIAFFVVPFYSMLRAIATVDPVFLNHTRVLGAGWKELWRDVYLPSTLGSLAAILRVTIQLCLTGAVISEYISSARGVGWVLQNAYSDSNEKLVVATIFLVSIIGFVLDRILFRIERRFEAWRIWT